MYYVYMVTLIEKVLANRVRTDSGCQEWQGGKRNGYGLVWWEGRRLSVHRVVWEDANGPIPDGMDVDHFRCYNEACSEITHLRLVTHAENMRNRAGARVDNKVGVRGVYWEESVQRFRVRVGLNGRQYGKRYKTLDEAAAAAEALRIELYGADYNQSPES